MRRRACLSCSDEPCPENSGGSCAGAGVVRSDLLERREVRSVLVGGRWLRCGQEVALRQPLGLLLLDMTWLDAMRAKIVPGFGCAGFLGKY